MEISLKVNLAVAVVIKWAVFGDKWAEFDDNWSNSFIKDKQ